MALPTRPASHRNPLCRFPRCNNPVFFDTRVNESREWCSDQHMRDAITYKVEKLCNTCQRYPRRNGVRYCSNACRPRSESFGNDNRYLPGSSPNQLSFDPDGKKRNIDSSPTFSSSPSSPPLPPVTTPLVPYTTQPNAPPFAPFSQEQHQQPQPSPSAGVGIAASSSPAITNDSSTSNNLELPLQCNICGKRNAQRQDLNCHHRVKHEPSSCMYCDYKWALPNQYRTHLKNHHPDIDPDLVLGKLGRSYRRAMHPTLSSWLKNMDKLSSLIDRLRELASATRRDRRRELYRQVATLRTAFEMQQKRYFEFLRLTEEYADRYLLDISAEIEQQSSFIDTLANRLDMANTLYSQAVNLRKSYESGTVDAMKSVRETARKQPLPAESDLFRQIDFVLGEISRCYRELDKFWTDEISRAVTALRTRRIDPGGEERWRGFKASLQQITESWNTNTQDGSIWNVLHDYRPGSSSGDLGAIASSLSPTLNTLRGWLQRIRESASVKYPNMCLTPILRAELGVEQNNDLCSTFFRHCLEFGEVVIATPTTFIGSAAFSRVKGSDGLLEDAISLGTLPVADASDASAENDTLPQDHSSGSWKFKYIYKQALSRQREMALGMNILVEIVSSWIVVADTLPNALPVGFSLKRLHNLADAWEKEKASMRRVLGALTDDPAERLRYQCLSSTPSCSCMARWTTNLVGFVRSCVTS